MSEQGAPPRRRPIAHKVPLPATVRKLYGTAFRCGKPDCGKPLYKLNDETGEIVLNSHVAHICARSEGGPRWDPKMTEDENRAETNLIPLCFEHAFEIDATPERYPVALLHEWKRAQIAEHFQMQKGWPLTEAEADEVVDASFGLSELGADIVRASSIASSARAVGHLIETARQQRLRSLEAALAWQSMRAGVQRSIPRAWDAVTGDLLPPVEPSVMQTKPFSEAFDATLLQVVNSMRPLISTIAAELHAVRAVVPDLEPWCNWIEGAAEKVLMASGRWPGRPPMDDDTVLDDALAELLRASVALAAKWRGDPSEQPPEPRPPAAEVVEGDEERLVREHSTLLESARPWARVDSRPYDASLYAKLVRAAPGVLRLPHTPMYLSVNMSATLRLAARVARNADDETFAALLNDAAVQQPVAVAVTLTRELMFIAQKGERVELEERARGYAVKLLSEIDVANVDTWTANEFHMRSLLYWAASVTSDAEVRGRISDAIAQRPHLLNLMLLGVCEQVERRDSHNFSHVLGIDVFIEDVPPWFPTSEVAAEIRRQHPNLNPSGRHERHEDSDAVHTLAAHILDADSRLA